MLEHNVDNLHCWQYFTFSCGLFIPSLVCKGPFVQTVNYLFGKQTEKLLLNFSPLFLSLLCQQPFSSTSTSWFFLSLLPVPFHSLISTPAPSLPLWPRLYRLYLVSVIITGFGFWRKHFVSQQREKRRETKGGHRTTRVSRWKFACCCFDQPFVFGAIHLQCGCENSVSTEWLMPQNVSLMRPETELVGRLKICFQNGNKMV